MNIVGKTVKHSVFGIGTVTKIEKDQILVKFDKEEKRFQYPSVFEKFLVAVDDSVNTVIQKEIVATQNKKAAAEQLAYEETARKQAELERLAQDQSMQTVSPKKKPISTLRIPGKRSTYFVFQGNTFKSESREGFIWAPLYNVAGGQSFHWDRLLDVHAGDVIFHGCDGKILAVSLAKDKCYEFAQPEELVQEELWNKEGRRIDCDYTLIRNPIRTAAFLEEILKYSSAKYSPFDRDGNGNMGYLYDLNRKLAKVFLNGILRDNAYLYDLDFVKELIEE